MAKPTIRCICLPRKLTISRCNGKEAVFEFRAKGVKKGAQVLVTRGPGKPIAVWSGPLKRRGRYWRGKVVVTGGGVDCKKLRKAPAAAAPPQPEAITVRVHNPPGKPNPVSDPVTAYLTVVDE